MWLTTTMALGSRPGRRIRARWAGAALCIIGAMTATGCGSDRTNEPDRQDGGTTASPSAKEPVVSLHPSRGSACKTHQAAPAGGGVSEREAIEDQELLLRDLDDRKIRVGTLSIGRCGDDVVIYLGLTEPVEVPSEGAHGTPVLTYFQEPFDALGQ